LAPLALALAACSVASPSTEVKESLARAAPLAIDSGAIRVDVARAVFSDVTVAPEGDRARVLAVVDADGRVRAPGLDVALAYLGREALELERCGRGRWCPVGPALPGLAGVVAAVAGAPRPEGRRPVAWQVRIERDRATVGEDAAGPDGGPALRAVLDLVPDGARWRIAAPP
jgi:hypothetical protein